MYIIRKDKEKFFLFFKENASEDEEIDALLQLQLPIHGYMLVYAILIFLVYIIDAFLVCKRNNNNKNSMHTF